MKKLVYLLLLLFPFAVIAQPTDAERSSSANLMRSHTDGQNTKSFVASIFDQFNQGKVSRIEFVPATGTNAYTASGDASINSFTKGFQVFIRFTNANTGASTLNFNGLGIKNLKSNDNLALVAGDITAKSYHWVVYDVADGCYKLSDKSGGGSGSSTFTGLTDGPGSFASKSLNYVRVNTGETALEYRTPAQTITDLVVMPLLPTNGVNVQLPNSSGTPYAVGLRSNASKGFISVANGNTQSQEGSVDIQANSASQFVRLSFDPANSLGNGAGVVFTESGGVGGIKYAADYSANYTSRSLVDKNYVDTHGGGYNLVQNSGSSLTTRSTINVTNGLTASDVSSKTQIELGGNSTGFNINVNSGSANFDGATNVDFNIGLSTPFENLYMVGNNSAVIGTVSDSYTLYDATAGTQVASLVGTLDLVGNNQKMRNVSDTHKFTLAGSGASYTVSMVAPNASLSLFQSTTSNVLMTYTDNNGGTKKGIVYAATGYVTQTHSLTDMEYVLAAKTYTDKQTFFTATTGAASITLPHGTAPTSPVNGDLWTTTSSIFARINGATKDLLSLTDFTGTLGVTHGGTGLTTISTGQLVYGSASNTISALAVPNGIGKFLRATALNAFSWSTLTIPNASTAGDIFYSSATNTMGALPIGSNNQFLTVNAGSLLWQNLANGNGTTASGLSIGLGGALSSATITVEPAGDMTWTLDDDGLGSGGIFRITTVGASGVVDFDLSAGGNFSIESGAGGESVTFGFGGISGGLKYGGDYSGTYTNRSLIDKGYADTHEWNLDVGGTMTGANTITGSTAHTLKFVFNSLGNTTTNGAGIWLANNTAATNSVTQWSPSLVLEAKSWDGSASKSDKWRIVDEDKSLSFGNSYDGGAYTDYLKLSAGGGFNLTNTGGDFLISGNGGTIFQINYDDGIVYSTKMDFGFIAGFTISGYPNAGYAGTPSTFNMTGDAILQVATDNDIKTQDNSAHITVNGTASLAHITSTTSQMIFGMSDDGTSGGSIAYFQDLRSTTRGIQYTADYSAGYDDRSLIDRGFANSRYFTIGSGFQNASKAYTNEYIVFNTATKGIVLKDTQGTPHYWKVTINNSGVLVTTDLGTSLP